MFPFKCCVTVLKQIYPTNVLKRLISSQVRVRFAPSPTGYLHLGGLRTALYNHLFAKSQNGVTILRIEDTDSARQVPLAADNLINDLAWCGITYDEGPYFQCERKKIYEKYAKQLLDQGDAYYCFCSTERLELMRRESVKAGEIPKYDNHCRHLSKCEIESCLQEQTPCIRFKLSSFTDPFNDLICGPTTHNVGMMEGDPVILKMDGFPTYHFANVVDDHLMNITHVLRGTEWITSTTKHILLYRALKWDPPHFGHLPLLMNDNGTKLSKRQSDIQIRTLRIKGYLPISLINFLTHFGGGFDFKLEKELKIYTFEELVKKFNLSKVKSCSCKVDLTLLPAYNQAEFTRQFETDSGKRALVKKIQEMVRNHFPNRLEDLIQEEFYYLWVWESKWNEENEIYNEFIKDLIAKIKNVNWTKSEIQEFLKIFCKQYSKFKYTDLMPTIRFALTGTKFGHGVAEIMCALSKEVVLFRLSKTIEPKKSITAGQN